MYKRLEAYEELLKSFQEKGYRCVGFNEAPQPEGNLLLRHDIDFDVELALEMAAVENQLGITATYFFMISSDSYNLLSKANSERIARLIEDGHTVSLHFDPTIYDDYTAGFRREREIFENTFGVEINCLSIHRPLTDFLDNDAPFDGVAHTYQPRYFSDIAYFADSRGSFRYGHPLKSQAFSDLKTIHLLIHPVWWVTDAERAVPILNDYLERHIRNFQSHMGDNCLPYREFLEKENGKR